MERFDKGGEHVGHRFSNRVEQHLDGRGAAAVPDQTHVFRPLNHRPVGLFHEQRTGEEAAQHHLGLVLPSQPCHQTVSSIQKGLVMVQHSRFTGVVNGPDAPNSVQGVPNHQRFPFLGHLLIGRVEGHEVHVRLHELTEKGVDG